MLLAACLFGACGCTSFEEWVHNGFKVGPSFEDPGARVADDWIDIEDRRIMRGPVKTDAWWTTFDDPTLNSLIETARLQNLDLKSAALASSRPRPSETSRPATYFRRRKTPSAIISMHRSAAKPDPASPMELNAWATGFNASWELDFWGRLRRQVESSNADLDASVEGYHEAMVTLLADVATSYVQIRTFQQRIAFARRNVEIQQGTLRLAQARLNQGKTSSLDAEQARSNLCADRGVDSAAGYRSEASERPAVRAAGAAGTRYVG